MNRLKMLLWSVAISLVLVTPYVLLPTADPDELAESKEGHPQDREAYYAQRRLNPYDTHYAAAAARLAAYNHMATVQAQVWQGQASALNFSQVHFETWQAVGPAPITGGQTPPSDFSSPSPVAGRVSSIAIDAIDNAVYVGGAQGGLWRTLNNGTSWTPLTDYLSSLAIGSIAIARRPTRLTTR